PASHHSRLRSLVVVHSRELGGLRVPPAARIAHRPSASPVSASRLQNPETDVGVYNLADPGDLAGESEREVEGLDKGVLAGVAGMVPVPEHRPDREHIPDEKDRGPLHPAIEEAPERE